MSHFFRLACEFDQGLTSASLGHRTHARRTADRWLLVSQDRDIVDVA